MKLSKNTTLTGLLLLQVLILCWIPGAQAEVRYATENLNIPMRSGASNQYRIIKFLPVGTRLEILESSEDGKYSKVREPGGKEGWVINVDMMDRPSAKDRIVVVQKQLDKVREQSKKLDQTIKDLEADNGRLENDLNAARREASALQSQYEELKRSTANPRAILNENSTLKETLNKITATNENLLEQNRKLREDETKEWFIIGASVSIGSLLFGLLITRIPWRKKRGWGEF